MYLDTNNLYAKRIQQSLPMGELKWLTLIEEIENCS